MLKENTKYVYMNKVVEVEVLNTDEKDGVAKMVFDSDDDGDDGNGEDAFADGIAEAMAKK